MVILKLLRNFRHILQKLGIHFLGKDIDVPNPMARTIYDKVEWYLAMYGSKSLTELTMHWIVERKYVFQKMAKIFATVQHFTAERCWLGPDLSFKKSFPNLVFLKLSKNKYIKDTSIQSIQLPSLRTLVFDGDVNRPTFRENEIMDMIKLNPRIHIE